MPNHASTYKFYEEAKEALIEYIDERDDIVTCWEYGTVSEPGVSDLDIIAIVKDKPFKGIAQFLRRTSLPEIVQKAMAHANLIIVPESYKIGLLYWDNINVRDIREPKLVIAAPVNLVTREQRYAMLVDWSIERIYRVKVYAQGGSKDQRKTLGDIKSFLMCVGNFILLFPSMELFGFEELEYGLSELRKDWVNTSLDKRWAKLAAFVTECATFATRYEELLFNVLECGDTYPDWYGSEEEYVFTFPDGMIWYFRNQFKKNEGPAVQVPKCLLHHYRIYCRQNAALSKKISASFSTTLREDEDMQHDDDNYFLYLKRRMQFCNIWYDYLTTNEFSYGLYKFGWYLDKGNFGRI